MTRLVEIELRKATDTRAGYWMIIALALFSLAIAISVLSGAEDGRTLDSMYGGVLYALLFLSPIFGVLAVTSEWSQRTTLTTFSLVPDRGRVIRAKTLAVTAMAVTQIAIALMISVLVFGIGSALDRTTGGWELAPTVIAQSILFQLVYMLFGLGMGLIALSSPPAVVLTLVLPNLLTSFMKTEGATSWINISSALEPLLDTGITGPEWAKILTVSLLWAALPMLAGLTRLARHEIK
jgi:ABC-type transport system involved in multi-copper enzyme maturation permease subunit